MSDNKKYFKEIVDYYDSSQILYKWFVYNSNSLGMHHGFWKKDTKNLQEAIINENQEVSDIAEIKKGYRVLDAGSGVGGTAIYIAKKTEAKVFGISLSRNQINLAKHYAKKHGVENLTNFQVQNYTKTNFPDNYFDVVYGIESICHAYPKKMLLKEAFRILKSGGKLIIADGYTSREPKSTSEVKVIKDFTLAFELKELITYKKMSKSISDTGFIKVKEIEKTKNVLPTIDYFINLFKKLRLPIKILFIFNPKLFNKWKRNIDAITCENEGMKLGLTVYYIHYAEKP